MAEAYPLHWPEGWSRTQDYERKWSQFKVTPDQALRELGWEVERLGGRYMVISSNAAVRRDGLPYAGQISKSLPDPGVAVYFERDGKQMCFACDTYALPWENIRAISKTIEAIRAIERYGATDMMERSLSAFEALPPPGDWRSELGINDASPSLEAVRSQYRSLVKTHHPDRGGDAEQFHRINAAWERAQRELA